MLFAPEDLEIARAVFEIVVGDEPSRALALAPVVRWSAGAWSAFADTMRSAGFNPRNPNHLAALQSLIDRACDA